jgi:hypothetical protein
MKSSKSTSACNFIYESIIKGIVQRDLRGVKHNANRWVIYRDEPLVNFFQSPSGPKRLSSKNSFSSVHFKKSAFFLFAPRKKLLAVYQFHVHILSNLSQVVISYGVLIFEILFVCHRDMDTDMDMDMVLDKDVDTVMDTDMDTDMNMDKDIDRTWTGTQR